MRRVMIAILLSLVSTSAVSAVTGVNKIRITSSLPTYLQISEVVAMSGPIDFATAANGATALDDGTGFWPGVTTPDTSHAIDGIGPTAFPDIYHSDTSGSDEFLLITLDAAYTIESLSIFGRGDSFSQRDIYDIQLLSAADEVLFEAFSQSANNGANEAVVELAPVPIPAAAWLFSSALLGLGAVKRKRS